jgi:GNAT superfamily N-acetyltransferase
MSSAISIRLARVSDAEVIARLTAQLGYEVGSSTVSARLSRILARADQRFLVAECDGQPVGWLHAVISEYVEADAFVLVGGLVVNRLHRRKGIGRMLMLEAEEWARQRGCSFVRLWSSSVRTASHRFYQQLGYTNIKTQYSFIKSVGATGQDVRTFVPRVDQE